MFGLGLDQVVDILTRLESRAIGVHPQQCSRIRHRRSFCTLCADCCPMQAIIWGESLQIDPDQCTGCGLCAAVCPTGALEAQAPTDIELLAHIQELVKQDLAITFACPRYIEAGEGDSDRFIPVNCLGRLDESILVGAVSLGAEAVWLMDGACQECPYAVAGPAQRPPSGKCKRGVQVVVTQAVQRANELLQAFGVQERIFIGPQVRDGLRSAARSPGAGETLSRRAFFSLLARRTTGAAATTAAVAVDSILGSQGAQSEEDHRPKKGQLPVHLSAKRRLLLAALRRIGKAVDVDLEVDGRLWAQFDIEESCTGCQMCAFFCPTGALSKIEKDGRASVAFRISFCTNCRLCQDICYKAAVDLSSAVALSKVLEDAVDTFLMRDVNAAPWTGNR